MTDTKAYEQLLDWLTGHDGVLVAFSGGVDSTLLAEAGYDALGERALALTAVSASLASRFPTGTPISVTSLGRVATAEALIASLGFSQYRVRFHDELARIELPPDELHRALEPELRSTIIDGIKKAGFRFVTIDLEGYSRGSSNAVAMGKETQ